MKTHTPLVSVIMPVYNAQKYLPKALNSILAQTYQTIEIICVDDGSTDRSYEILLSYAKKDTRFRVHKLSYNSGASTAANTAIKMARGRYICRMDADDVMVKDRIEKQVSFLQENTSVIAVGGQCLRIDKNGKKGGIKPFPVDHQSIRSMIFRSVPIQQPTIMIDRNKLPKSFGWYLPKLKIGEDYELYYKLMKYGRLANLDDVVLLYREYKENLTLSSQKETFWWIWKTRIIALFQHKYVPDIPSVFNVLMQTILVVILPESLLYPIHMKTRQLFFRSQ